MVFFVTYVYVLNHLSVRDSSGSFFFRRLSRNRMKIVYSAVTLALGCIVK